MFKALLLFLLLFILHTSYFILPNEVAAQGIEVTNVYDVTDPDTQDGDIVISTGEGIVRATRPYDSRMFGVVQLKPIITYRRVDNTGLPITRTGVARVNVTTLNGPIVAGDYITSSEIPGKGQKAGLSGHAVGISLENFDGAGGETVQVGERSGQSGKIQIAVKMEYAELTGSRSIGRTFDYFNNAFFKNVQDPEKFTQVVRYMVAGIAVLVSFAIAFIIALRSIPKAMEAIGRNPLASNTIRISILINVGLTIGIGIIGIVAAIIILKI
jgi:F0F1-type ATP synthase membrane subunit c/vacuolar-type H+-ATPase subunit K